MNGQRHLVELQDVTRRYDEHLALDKVSLRIRQGEFFSILGPSGCGKSTLLRLIAGLDWPDAGSLLIDGRDMRGVPPYRRPCNMVFQNYAIFPHLNVRDNVGYGLRKFGLSAIEKRERIEAMLVAVRLGGLGDRKPGQLSGGQRQRVALARALVRQPRVLLLDEPLGALDKSLREAMQVELRELQQSVGITFVFVTHDQEEALSMSDRIAVMSDGRILQIASPVDLYERPNCPTVAKFIGDMNFFGGVTEGITASGGALVLVDGMGAVEFDGRLENEKPGLSHQVAIRPEKLRVTGERTDAAICVRGKVVSSSYWGDQSQIQVFIDGCATPLTVSAHNVDPAGAEHLVRGADVYLSVNRSGLLRFCEEEVAHGRV
jgi:ABC-type Fe3+/spermidine/putrescine transport system ATPase subunit